MRTIDNDLTERGLGCSPDPTLCVFLLFGKTFHITPFSIHQCIVVCVKLGHCGRNEEKQVQQSRKLSSNSNQVFDSCFSIFTYFLDATNSNTVCDTENSEHAEHCLDEATKPGDKDYTDTEGV